MRRGLALTAFLAASLITAGTAQASFHLMKVSEVGNGNPVDYVELQMYASGQNFVEGHSIRTYSANGQELSTFTFPDKVDNGGTQRTILVARGDGPLGTPPDFVASGGNDLAIPEDGAVCFLASVAPVSAIDCVSFGDFTGVPDGDPPPMGTPAPPLTFTSPDGPGTSIHRTIAPNCPTFLEASDDTDNSATDFAVGPPTPRNNSTAPTEKQCQRPDTRPPETTITKKPKAKTTKRRVKIEFESSEPGSTFTCKLDDGSAKPCDSPFRKAVSLGRHRFQVVATDKAGNADASPAKVRFRRVAKKKG